MKKIILFIVLAALCQNFISQAQGLNHDTKPLSIGDTMPDSIWNMPFQAVNHDQSKKSVKLNEYKGRPIILDFWATWCSSCINHFPKMDSLEKEFGQSLQIILVNSITGTGDTEAKVNTFFNTWNSNHTKRLIVPSIFGDAALKRLFPHSYIPHYVWIGSDGKIQAITSSEEITSKNIQLLINHTALNLPIKKH
jgi:thiol-disulfide isomerase/thioredoxin